MSRRRLNLPTLAAMALLILAAWFAGALGTALACECAEQDCCAVESCFCVCCVHSLAFMTANTSAWFEQDGAPGIIVRNSILRIPLIATSIFHPPVAG